MPTPHQHRKSSVAGKTPSANNILIGEISINLEDQILHSKDTANNVFRIKADPVYSTGLQDNLNLKANVADTILTGSATANNLIITGTLQVSSNTTVINLDADTLDGYHDYHFASNSHLILHTSNTSNPHGVTKAQVGLSEVDNESKLSLFSNPVFSGNVSIVGSLEISSNTLVSNLNSDYLDGQHGSFYTSNSLFSLVHDDLYVHTSNTSNPHGVTKAQIGLSEVTNESKSTMFSNPVFTGTTSTGNVSIIGSLEISSNTTVTNLNSDYLDGQHGSFYTSNSSFSLVHDDLYVHTSNTSNPHGVTKAQIGLGEVTNESKSTMFSNPLFSGTVTANNLNITGTIEVTSNTLVSNLNSDYLDGEHGSFYTSNSAFSTLSGNFSLHTSNTSNPHGVTKSQVGLSEVTNESKSSMFSNPVFTGNVSIVGSLEISSNTLVSNLNSDYLDGEHGSFYTSNSNFTYHTSNTSNPHGVTKAQVGLSAVDNESKSTMFSNPVFSGTVTANGAAITSISLSSGVVGVLPVLNGGTGITTSTGTGSVVLSNSPNLIAPNIDSAIANTIITTGDVTIGGNLIVNGTSVTANSVTLLVQDKNIELGVVVGASDSTADGGGITLKGTTDKTIIWDIINSNWSSSESWNLGTGKVYKINNVGVLSSNTLGSSVVNSSLTSVGTLVNLTVTNPISGSITGTANNITGTYGGTLSSGQITTGLGFTPYNDTNPAGYITISQVPTHVTSVSGRSGIVTLTSSDVGLANCDNTSDANKPVSTATQGALDLKASITSNTGGIILPSGTTAERDNEEGSIRKNSTLNRFEGCIGGVYGPLGGGATGGGSDAVFVENDQVVTTDYTLTTGKNAHSVGPITISDGIVVTIPDNSNWVIS